MDREKNSRFLGRGNKSHPGNLRANLTFVGGVCWRGCKLYLLSDEGDDGGRAVGNRKRIGYDWESLFLQNRRGQKSFKAGLRCRSKRQPGDLPTTDWLESRVNESVPATGEPRTMKAARSTGDQTGQSTATRIMQTSLHSPLPKCQDVDSRPKWVVPLDFWWIEKGPSPTSSPSCCPLAPADCNQLTNQQGFQDAAITYV